MASDEMLEPGWLVRFADIERYRNMSEVSICWFMYGNNVHPVPEFYKYDWWIFWEGAPVDGDDLIFSENYRMNISEANLLYDRLMKEKAVFFMYNRKRPRRDCMTPFNPNAKRWEGLCWAPSLKDDLDPLVTEGPWAGHK